MLTRSTSPCAMLSATSLDSYGASLALMSIAGSFVKLQRLARADRHVRLVAVATTLLAT
jgi:hypothetical protein